MTASDYTPVLTAWFFGIMVVMAVVAFGGLWVVLRG